MVIGIIGRKGSGKSSFFKELNSLLDNNLKEVQLAGPLKDLCSDIFHLNRQDFENPDYKEKSLEIPVCLESSVLLLLIQDFGSKYLGKDLEFDFDQNVRPHIGKFLHTPREIAQYIGTEVLRSLDYDIHCKAAYEALDSSYHNVITDIRFPNEFDFFSNNLKEDFFPIYIQRNECDAKAGLDPHPSEAYFDKLRTLCKYEVNNNKDYSHLKKEAKYISERIFK